METRKTYGWGHVGSDKKGFEWLFTPNCKDPAYKMNPDTGRCYPHCRSKSGYVFKSEAVAIESGKNG